MPGRGGPNTRTPLPGGGGMPGRGGGGAGIPGRGGAGGPLTICSGGGGPAATTLLVPKVGYRLAAELRRAGVFVKIVQDKSQAADWALKRQMVHSMSRGIDWLFLVSDDSGKRGKRIWEPWWWGIGIGLWGGMQICGCHGMRLRMVTYGLGYYANRSQKGTYGLGSY